MNKRVAHLVVGMALAVLAAAPAHAAPVPDSPTGMSPANALVMPFDVSAKRNRTRLFVQNLAGESSDPAITTRWRFWDEDGSKLAEMTVCMHNLAAVEIDPRELHSVDERAEPTGSAVDLSGTRGFVVVTAYQTTPFCGGPSRSEGRPLDDALMGSFAIKEGRAKRAFSGPAAGFGLDEHTGHTTLPTTPFGTRFHIPVRVTKKSDFSRVVLIQLGQGTGGDGSLGPVSPLGLFTAVWHIDGSGEPTNSVDLGARVYFGTATPGAPNSLSPDAGDRTAAGTLAVESVRLDGDIIPVYVLAFHGEYADRLATTRTGVQVD